MEGGGGVAYQRGGINRASVVLTKTKFLRGSRSEDWSQLLGVSRENQLTTPGVIRVQEVRNRNDAFRLGRMAGFVNENVREVIARKVC